MARTSLTFENLGRLTRDVVQQRTVRILLDDFSPGIHALDDVFFRKSDDGTVAWVVSRSCDHAGGKLILKNDTGEVICPMHGWRLNTDTLQYHNVQVRKPQLEFEIKDGVLEVPVDDHAIRLPRSSEPAGEVTVRFLAHACVVIDIAGLRIVTDPWLIGPCFNLGWWPAFPPKNDAIDLLRSADFVFVSHNHPDHCHLETLSLLAKDTPVIVPDFQSGSTQKIIELTDHKKIIPLSLGHAYQVAGTELVFSILKSGDFRDDGGLYLGHGNFQALFTVDSSHLNCGVLPREIDLLMTAFSCGASGYPLCFDNYDQAMKIQIAEQKRRSLQSLIGNYVRATRPRTYIPYAGFFTEAADRDRFIRDNNHKNNMSEIINLVRSASPDTHCINPLETDLIVFNGDEIETAGVDRPPLYEVNAAYVDAYIADYKSAFDGITPEAIAEYFENSGFRDRLRLLLVPTDDHFSPHGTAFDISFSDSTPQVRRLDAESVFTKYEAHDADADNRILLIKVRRESLGHIIANCMPWEDLQIGFQCRITRKPDIYNSDFWYHFSNEYVGEEHRRTSERCDGCARIIHRINSIFECA